MQTWNRKMSLKGLMLVLVCLNATSPFSWTDENRKAILVRELKKDSIRPVDLSSNGRFILTIGERKNPELRGARLSVLAVYETNTGKIVGKPVVEAERKFTAAIFDGSQRVLALETQYIYSLLSKPAVLLEWDLVSGKLSELPVKLDRNFKPACILNKNQFLGFVFERGDVAQELLTVAEDNGVLPPFRQPDDG